MLRPTATTTAIATTRAFTSTSPRPTGLPRAHDGVRALYRHRAGHVRELLARLCVQLEEHESRYQGRAWDTGALVELTDVETWLGKLVASLDAVEARAAARSGGVR